MAHQYKRNYHVLPGLLPFMKFSTFKAPDNSKWPDDSFQKWFKAHGPKLEAVTAMSFKELFSLSPILPSARDSSVCSPFFL
jgi:hypothetical protein